MFDSATLSHFFVLASSLFLAGSSYRLSEKHDNTALMVISLAAAFIACSAAGPLLISGMDQDSQTLQRMLDNLAFYSAIPLIASAFLDLSHKFKWSKAAWGRWLLALFALFELCRRTEIGIEYSQFMSACCAIVLIHSAIRMEKFSRKFSGFAAGLLLGLSLLLFSSTSLLPEFSNSLFYGLSLALSLTFIALSLKQIPAENS